MPLTNPTSNTFYIAANIIFDLGAGETKQVLMLVNKPEDASIFTAKDARNYLNFVKQRARNIVWSIEYLSPTPFPQPFEQPTDRFIIKGVQYV